MSKSCRGKSTGTAFSTRIQYSQSASGAWDFNHNGRGLEVRTVVGVPAGALSIRNMWEVTSYDTLSLYLVVLDSVTAIRFDGHATSLRMTFTCREASEDSCRAVLAERLRRGTAIQSLGVPDAEMYAGKLPDTLIFSFHMNADGIYRVGAVETPKF